MTAKHIRRKTCAGLAALALTACLTPVHAIVQVPVSSYRDVDLDTWYAMPAEFCYQYGLIDPSGTDTFSPNVLLTRGDLVQAIYRLEGCPKPYGPLEPDQETPPLPLPGIVLDTIADEPVFSDMTADDPCLKAVQWAAQRGVVHGFPDGTFRPQASITREEIAVLLWNSRGNPEPAAPLSYADGEEVPDWAADAVAWAQIAGVMVGDEADRFCPLDNVTRSQGATLFMNIGKEFYGLPDVSFPTKPEPDPNPYDNTLFSKDENGYLSYHGAIPSRRGIDVSSHQKTIDWARVAAAGMDFAMIRAGYRGYAAGSLNKDAYFEYNIRNALANGLDVGVYFFSQAINIQEAEEEAYMLLELIQGYDVTYPVVFDWEIPNGNNVRTEGTDGDTVTACARAFCKVIEDAGYIPMTYGSPNKINKEMLKLGELPEYPAFWLANYTKNAAPTTFRYHYDMWQYSSTGRVDGIEGNVDLDICLTDWSAWGREAPAPETEETVPGEANDPEDLG